MNGCLIPKETLINSGFLSDYFVHGGADFEYGLKICKAGGEVILAPTHIGVCDRNQVMDNYLIQCRSLSEGYKTLLSEKKEPLRQRFIYYKKHGGNFWILLFIAPYLSLLFKYHFSKLRSIYKSAVNEFNNTHY